MYRGIAHSGLSRIPTSRHVPIRINKEYGYRKLSSSAGLWGSAPSWGFRGNKASREKTQVQQAKYEKMVARDKKMGFNRSTDPAWESIPPPAIARKMGPVEFRPNPPTTTEGTALTGSETSFIWDKDNESTKVDPMLPASAVLGRVRPNPPASREAESSSTTEATTTTGSGISWSATSSSSNGEKASWAANPSEVSWTPPRIRMHMSDTPAWQAPIDFKQRGEKQAKPPRLPKFRSHGIARTERDDFDHRINKWPTQTYSAIDGELEPWNGEQSELAGSATENGANSGSETRGYEERKRFLSEYDGRPNFSIHADNRHGGVFGDDREEITVFKKPARVLPYSSASSEFLYGYNICKLAMKEKRRKIYKLYVYTGLMRQSGTIEKENLLRRMAAESRIHVESTMDVGLLDAMSKGRPHNGFALEAEPLEIPKVGHLVAPSKLGVFNAPVYQSPQYVQIKIKGKDRRPFVLVLDEVLDGGNFGAILRSAYFLGVDAVFIVSKNSTPATAVTSRSSAGALECIDYYDVGHLSSFISRSQDHGWKFYGAMPSPSQQDLKASKTGPKKWYDMEGLGDPTSRHPVALVLGNEAEGLRPSIQKMMDAFVTIRRAEEVDVVVDSLNVGVAASILTHAFLYPAVKGAESEWARDRRTQRREAVAAAKENMLFQVDDGKYTVPRYEGVNKVTAATAGAEVGELGGKPALWASSEGQEVEEDPLKGWNPDDDVDEPWEGMEENGVVGENGDEGLKEIRGEVGDKTSSGIDEAALKDVQGELGFKEVRKVLISDNETSEELERRMAAEVASEFVLDRSESNKSDNVIDTEKVDMMENTLEKVVEPSKSEEEEGVEEVKAEAETEAEEPEDEIYWEDIHGSFEEDTRDRADFYLKKEPKEKSKKKKYEWEEIKPQEIDFTAGLVGPPPVTKPATNPPDARLKSKESTGEESEAILTRKLKPNLQIPKRLQEIAAQKGVIITGTPTKKQIKMLKKESKKLQQQLRKKVRDDASAVREALQNKHDPKVLMKVHGQSIKSNCDVNHEKNEEREKEGEKIKEEKEKTMRLKGKSGKIKQKGKDKTDYVKAGTWSVSEIMQ
ncbi:hypothetical protein TWF225_010003 [Orbilia oligospora]|nr:hypothetical protein TWF225_010003 [Orbilia oligospora]KAF3271181.1 hypothetical protein TWF217_005592 [Orbilia oligospora]KAF3271729.1 hypothetical protein TWF128_000278 [Orbilia oligospora]